MVATVPRSSPLAGFPADVQDLKDRLWAIISEGRTVLGDEVRRFESAFADYLEVSSCCGVNCGLDALILALRALGLKPGDEVVTQANTFHATVLAICAVGATPVLVDAHPETFQMDAGQVPEVIGERTRVILPVHLYGMPAPFEEISTLARSHGLRVVEDAAQAHGAICAGRRVGSLGDVSCFSFHPSKNLAAAGDAGAVCTSDPAVAERLRILRWMGQAEQNDHVCLGLNSKLDALQAAILMAKLPQLDHCNSQRRRFARLYLERLEGLPVAFQAYGAADEPVYHLFQLRSRERDRLLAHLLERGIEAAVRYPVPIHLQPAFARFGWRRGQFPVAEALANELLCLPLRPDMRMDEIDFVCDSVRAFFERRSARGRLMTPDPAPAAA